LLAALAVARLPVVLSRLLIGGVGLTLLALVATSCGARTELGVPAICATEGEARPCQDGCGTGSQTCTDGLWSVCAVPVVTRRCNDGCGDGEESCRDGRWQGCLAPLVQRDCSSVCGAGHETCKQGVWGACDAPQPKPPKLEATVRDFSPKTHPDFEAAFESGLDAGIVQSTLGPDDKPVYASIGRTKSTTGAANFNMWFNDTPMINLSKPLELQLLPVSGEPGFFTYDDQDFFPIDDELLGNEGRGHNFHFTLQASTTFEYRGSEVFSFSGDDDMWVFINRRLAIDLGGLHQSLSANVVIDDFARTAGMTPGSVYPLHFFFAERHTIDSHFTIRTSIADPGSCD
jgi:fibro-slime domain-containing protein